MEIGTLPSRGERQQQAVIALHIWGLCLVLVPRQEWRHLPIDAQRSNMCNACNSMVVDLCLGHN